MQHTTPSFPASVSVVNPSHSLGAALQIQQVHDSRSSFPRSADSDPGVPGSSPLCGSG